MSSSAFVVRGDIMVTRTQWEQHVLDCLVVLTDVGVISHDSYARPRPYPYDTTVDLKLTDGGDPEDRKSTRLRPAQVAQVTRTWPVPLHSGHDR